LHLAVIAPLLAAWALLALVAGAGLLCALGVPRWRARIASYTRNEAVSVLGLAWLAAATATLGSLYFSEIVGFVPCLLCWYQRIAMYPLVVVLGVAALTRDARVWRYVLPIVTLGVLISSYHVLIQFRPALDVVACSADVPCTARYLAVFGFVSIPVMASGGFVGIGALMLALRTAERAQPSEPDRE
jgi:disulfide bond formation protein DsbB